MNVRVVIAAAAAALLGAAGCANSMKVTGSASDGETFTGVAVAGGDFTQVGTLQLVSNRGLTCIGTYAFEGTSGPKGKADINCSDGTATVAALDMPSRTGTGTLGTRSFQLRW